MEYITRQLVTVASTSEQGGDLFSSLGINWTLLALQTVAFLILLFILKKFVYPPLVAMLDKRDDAVRASADAAMEAEASGKILGDKVDAKKDAEIIAKALKGSK